MPSQKTLYDDTSDHVRDPVSDPTLNPVLDPVPDPIYPRLMSDSDENDVSEDGRRRRRRVAGGGSSSESHDKKSWSYADGLLVGVCGRLLLRRSSSFDEDIFGLATVAEQLGIKNGVIVNEILLEEPWSRKKKKRSKHGGKIIWRIVITMLACIFIIFCSIVTGLIVLVPILNIDAVPRSPGKYDDPNLNPKLTFDKDQNIRGSGLFMLLIDNPSAMDLQFKFETQSDTTDSVTHRTLINPIIIFTHPMSTHPVVTHPIVTDPLFSPPVFPPSVVPPPVVPPSVVPHPDSLSTFSPSRRQLSPRISFKEDNKNDMSFSLNNDLEKTTKVDIFLLTETKKDFAYLNSAKLIDSKFDGAVRVPIQLYDFEVPMIVYGRGTPGGNEETGSETPTGSETDAGSLKVVCEDDFVLAKVIIRTVTVHSIAGQKSWHGMNSRLFPLPCVNE